MIHTSAPINQQPSAVQIPISVHQLKNRGQLVRVVHVKLQRSIIKRVSVSWKNGANLSITIAPKSPSTVCRPAFVKYGL